MDQSSASSTLHAQPHSMSLFCSPTSVKWAHYTDMLICEDLPLLQDTLQTWLEHL